MSLLRTCNGNASRWTESRPWFDFQIAASAQETRDHHPAHPGLEGHAEIVVGEQHTAPKIGSGRVRVLATPVMINLMEAAALDAVENLIPAGNQSLGTHLDVRHIAATPVGMRVRATARLLAVDGRTLQFRVEAHDEKRPDRRRRAHAAGRQRRAVRSAGAGEARAALGWRRGGQQCKE